MAKKEHVNKHPDWRLSARERFNYYLSDSGRLFGTSVLSVRVITREFMGTSLRVQEKS